ncbi:MAG: hypothetical protein GTO60_16670 [Gammaproteobacteria bacterium]|nr:hypothetical protein [Gammaproteobacteria bacterium]
MTITTHLIARRPATTKTIDATGIITIDQFKHIVAANSGVADDLNTINIASSLDLTSNGNVYQPDILLVAQTGHSITLKHNVGNILLQSGTDFLLTGGRIIQLHYDGTNWTDAVSTFSAGETNTASNQGTGVGVFNGKVGVDLEFRSLVPASPVTVALDAPNKEIDIGLDADTFDILAPTTTKGDLIAHDGSDNVRLAVGTDGQMLVADSTDASGLSYSNPLSAPDGLEIARVTDSILRVNPGRTLINNRVVAKTTMTVLDLSVNGDWMDVVANGGFDTDTVWNKGANWSIAGGLATHTPGAIAAIQQLSIIEAGTSYELTFTISGRTAGNLTPALGATSGTTRSTNATFTETIVSAGTDLIFNPSSDFDGSIDNVTLTPIEAASSWVHAYIASDGAVKLFHRHPNYPVANTASRVFTAQVNQAGWDGTAGLGLNAATVVYDGDTGEGNIVPGMLLAVYDDPAYILARGKGSAAGISVNNESYAVITAINTGANTITLDTNGFGHQIAINDNDYIVAIQSGKPEYAYIGGIWYRWLGALWNDGSSNLVAANNQYGTNRTNDKHTYTLNEIADYTTSSTSFVDVDATNLTLTISSRGGRAAVSADLVFGNTGTTDITYFDFTLNGVRVGGDDGMILGQQPNFANNRRTATIYRVIHFDPGVHTVVLQWKTNNNTSTLYAGAGASLLDIHSQIAFMEV